MITNETNNLTIDDNGLFNNSKDIITIGVPQEVIDDVMSATVGKTMLFRSKALFLVWLINRGDRLLGQSEFNNSYYQLHIRAHRKLFGSDDLDKIKMLLIKNNIIKQIGVASAEDNRCNTFKINKWWKFKGKNTVLIHFPTSYSFADKFQKMHYWVLPKNEQKILAESIGNINEKIGLPENLNNENEEVEEMVNDNITPQQEEEIIHTHSKDGLNIYEKYIQDLIDCGVSGFETLFASTSQYFVPKNTPDAIASEQFAVIFDYVEEIMEKNNI